MPCSRAHGVEVIGYWGEAVTSPAQARAVLDDTGAAGLAGDLFVDGALGSRTAWLHEPYDDASDHTGTCYLDPEAVTAHLRACTEAGVTAGFHVIGDAAVSQRRRRFGTDRRRPRRARGGSLRPPLGAPGDGDRRPGGQARRVGCHGQHATQFRRALGRPTTACMPVVSVSTRAGRLNPFALLASQGVALAFGSDAPVTGLDPWATVRAAVNHHTPDSSISARAAFAAATRGGWRAGGAGDELIGSLVPGAPASYAVWDVGELDVSAPSDAVRRWSTDPRSRVPDCRGSARPTRCPVVGRPCTEAL